MGNVKIEFSGITKLERRLMVILKRSKRLFIEALDRKIRKLIINDHILKGVTPVAGGRWDVPYSKSYQDQINKYRGKRPKRGKGGKFVKGNKGIPSSKKTRPVNLKLHGDLLKSFYTNKVDGKQSLIIGFSDEKFKYHNKEGAGKSKAIRRMLPTEDGERFKSSIELKMRKILQQAIKVAVRSRK